MGLAHDGSVVSHFFSLISKRCMEKTGDRMRGEM